MAFRAMSSHFDEIKSRELEKSTVATWIFIPSPAINGTFMGQHWASGGFSNWDY